MRNKVKDSNARDKSEDSGDEILRFLQKKKSQKRRSHSSNDRNISSAEAKRVGSANPSQSVGNTSQNSIQPSRIHSLPEPSLAPKGFTALVREQMPRVFFFLVDVYMNAIQTGATAAACSAINQAIADLPFSVYDMDKVGYNEKSLCGSSFCLELLFGPSNGKRQLSSSSVDDTLSEDFPA